VQRPELTPAAVTAAARVSMAATAQRDGSEVSTDPPTRIGRAMALLRRGDQSVTEVCFAVGCSSLGTFSIRFTELVGMSPGAYRRQARRVPAGVPSCVAKQVSRPVRNREAPASPPLLP
jgi:hypothetical protein